MRSLTPNPRGQGGFIREQANASTRLLVTHCQMRKAPWYAWSRSLRMLEIAELSHCQACSHAGQCPYGSSGQYLRSSRI
jgi:hypothetical protein